MSSYPLQQYLIAPRAAGCKRSASPGTAVRGSKAGGVGSIEGCSTPWSRYAETIAAGPLTALEGADGLRDRLADAAGDDISASTRLGMLVAAADESLARQFRAAGFAPEEARGRAQIAAATMHSLALRARAGAPKTELQQVGDAAVMLLSR